MGGEAQAGRGRGARTCIACSGTGTWSAALLNLGFSGAIARRAASVLRAPLWASWRRREPGLANLRGETVFGARSFGERVAARRHATYPRLPCTPSFRQNNPPRPPRAFCGRPGEGANALPADCKLAGETAFWARTFITRRAKRPASPASRSLCTPAPLTHHPPREPRDTRLPAPRAPRPAPLHPHCQYVGVGLGLDPADLPSNRQSNLNQLGKPSSSFQQ